VARLPTWLDRRVVFFGGKGGVGKTTCSAAAALASSREGKRVLLVSADPAHSTSDVFERRIGPAPVRIDGRLSAMELDADSEIQRYVDEVKDQIGRVFSRGVLAEVVRQIEVAASMPGAADVALFDRMSELMQSAGSEYDQIVFDTAPTGHTLRLLRMPGLMRTWMAALISQRRLAVAADHASRDPDPADVYGPDAIVAALERRADRLERAHARLTDRRTTGLILVLTPERLPIEETDRAIHALREADLNVSAVIVNRVLPPDLEGEFYRARLRQEQVYRDEIDRRFGDLPRVVVPQLESDVHGLAAIERISAFLRPS
jgi:arsenite/tail-anchored protein-transporting ATPase